MSHKIPRVQIDRTIYETWSHRTRHIYMRMAKTKQTNSRLWEWQKQQQQQQQREAQQWQQHWNCKGISNSFWNIWDQITIYPNIFKEQRFIPKRYLALLFVFFMYFFLQISFSKGTEPPSAFRYIISVNFGTFSKLKNKTKIFAHAYSSFLPLPPSIPFQSSAF